MTRCIIVDDEPLAQQVIESHINKTEGLVLLEKCSNAPEAFAIISQHRVDLIFHPIASEPSGLHFYYGILRVCC
mgnify:CR=1 FL=1